MNISQFQSTKEKLDFAIVTPLENEPVYTKDTKDVSCNLHFLDDIKRMAVRVVFVTGVNSTVCVKESIRGLLNRQSRWGPPLQVVGVQDAININGSTKEYTDLILEGTLPERHNNFHLASTAEILECITA